MAAISLFSDTISWLKNLICAFVQKNCGTMEFNYICLFDLNFARTEKIVWVILMLSLNEG